MIGLSFIRSVAFYPVTQMYGAAVVTIVGVSEGWFDVGAAAAFLLICAVLIILTAMRGEVLKVHVLVNSQHDDLVETVKQMASRIDQLVAALEEAGQSVPAPRSDMEEEGHGPRPAN